MLDRRMMGAWAFFGAVVFGGHAQAHEGEGIYLATADSGSRLDISYTYSEGYVDDKKLRSYLINEKLEKGIVSIKLKIDDSPDLIFEVNFSKSDHIDVKSLELFFNRSVEAARSPLH